ncbi:ABC transporter substrate-binding protein [Luoshenia tenuis]|jgi:multiple sugar transport system substrate-binding protein|uniref:ABC transporter substrate-binding protein n=1 Tax=Luoshenia tenuis TaxID=2763654 RepID=UPI003D8D57B9
MKKRWTLALSLILVVAMGLTLVGCGGAPDSSASTGGEASSGASGGGTGMATEPTEIVFWDMAWGGAEAYPPLAEETLNRYTTEVDPNVTFNYTNLPWSNWFETFSTAVASNSAPDFATGGGFMPFQFAVNGEAADLSWIVDEWKKEGTDTDFPEGTLDYWVYKDKQVGIPWNFDPRMTVIRNDWLQEEGLSMPTNFEEFIDVAKVFRQRGDDVYGVSFGVAADGKVATIYGTMNGGIYYDKDGNADLDKQETYGVMKWINDMKKAGVLPEGIEGYQGEDAKKLFLAEKAGILIGGCSELRESLAAGFDVAIVPPLETYEGGIMKYQNCINGFMVFEQSQHKDIAMKVLKWYSENTGECFQKGEMNPLPARTSFFEQCDQQYQQMIIKEVIPNAVPLCYPLTACPPSASSVEGQRFAMELTQSALTMDENGWKDTVAKLQTQLEGLVNDLDQ